MILCENSNKQTPLEFQLETLTLYTSCQIHVCTLLQLYSSTLIMGLEAPKCWACEGYAHFHTPTKPFHMASKM